MAEGTSHGYHGDTNHGYQGNTSYGYHSDQGERTNDIKFVIQTLLQQAKQNESLHTKIDQLNKKVDNLAEQLTAGYEPTGYPPQIIVDPANHKGTDRNHAKHGTTSTGKHEMDYLAINNHSDWSTRSRPTSFGSADSGFAHVSVDIDNRHEVNETRRSDYEEGCNKSLNVKRNLEDQTFVKYTVSNDRESDDEDYVNHNVSDGSSSAYARQSDRGSINTKNTSTSSLNKEEMDTKPKPISTDKISDNVTVSGTKPDILDPPTDYSKVSRKERVKITPVISDEDSEESSIIKDHQTEDLKEGPDKPQPFTNGSKPQTEEVSVTYLKDQQMNDEEMMELKREDQQVGSPHQQLEATPSVTTDITVEQEHTSTEANETDVNAVHREEDNDVDECNQTSVDGTYPRKRAYSANFGSEIPQPRSASPFPVARKRIRTPYSYFKRQKTVIFDDNRPKYFDKMLDIESFSGTEDVEPIECLLGETVKSFEAGLLSNYSGNQPSLPRNNEMIPASGFQNEHGSDDNRFVQEAHTDSSKHVDSLVHGNLSIIRPSDTLHSNTGQQASSNQTDKTKEESGGSHNLARMMVQDTEIHFLIEEEKKKAVECTDSKSMHGIDTVICLDTSASMNGEPLTQAKQFILEFLTGLDASATEFNLEENVALVTFGRENQVLQHLTNDYDLVRNALETVNADGPSPLWLGIGLCLTELSTRGGACTMDSLKVLPRIIIISDFFSSVKNRLLGPDIQEMEMKGNSEVAGIIEKNRSCVSSFNFVLVGSKYNQVLLDQIGQDRVTVYTKENVLYLSQFFRAQDLVNVYLTKRAEEDIGEDYLNTLVKERGMTQRSEMDIMKVIQERTQPDDTNMSTELVPSSMDPDHTVVIDDVEEPAFGTGVKPNPEWVGYHSRQEMSGTVMAKRKHGCLKVIWDDGTQERLKYGVNGEYNILVDESDQVIDVDNVKLGSVVERGQNWRWGDQDGGAGNIGVISSYDSGKKVVKVLWEQGGQGNYRYGYSEKYDVVLRSVLQRDKEANEKRPFWQMRFEDDTWIFLSPEINEIIEKKYFSQERNTFLVNIKDIPYRFSVKSLTARNTCTNSNHTVQRLELTRAEWLHMTNEP